MPCLIIGIVWVFFRFIASFIAKATDYKPREMGCFGYLLWIFGWLGNIALLIIGAATVLNNIIK